RDSSVEVPGPNDLFPTATKAVIKRSGRAGENKYELLVVGVERAAIQEFERGEFLSATYRISPVPAENTPELEALHLEVIELAGKVLKHSNMELPAEFARMITENADPLQMAYLLGSVLSMDVNLEH